MKTILIFDIGKTNKKCLLFDENLKVVFEKQQQFKEIKDEEGFPAEDLDTLTTWIKSTLHELLSNQDFQIEAMNFSAYGASFVNLDSEGHVLTPLYNYLKPYPEKILSSFYKKYGPQLQFSKETASPPLGMLNSGLQLYWLKYTKPEVFKKIKWSLHLPQYLSYLFTGIPVSDYTSIGCHTALWDFAKKDYHQWVYLEEIDKILSPISHSEAIVTRVLERQNIKIGPGIHDSSAALLPYLKAEKDPFLLISTGSWSISLNPYNQELFSEEDLKRDSLNYMQTNGNPVKATRLFLGKEHEIQVKKLNTIYGKAPDYYQKVTFIKDIYNRQKKDLEAKFHFENIQLPRQQPRENELTRFRNFESAYHRLMIELIVLQAEQARRAIGTTTIKKIYLDGGFSDNTIFINLLKRQFPNYQVETTTSPIGSALGAALAISGSPLASH